MSDSTAVEYTIDENRIYELLKKRGMDNIGKDDIDRIKQSIQNTLVVAHKSKESTNSYKMKKTKRKKIYIKHIFKKCAVCKKQLRKTEVFFLQTCICPNIIAHVGCLKKNG